MAAPRSKSVPAGRVSGRIVNIEEEDNAFPVLDSDLAHDQDIAPWVHELATARTGRQSRASSIVSTRTRFSTTTFDDARSIDIQAGNQSFRISRYGDRITDTTAPPPYSDPENNDIFPNYGAATQPERATLADVHAQQDRRRTNRNIRKVRIAMPGQDDASGANDDESSTIDTPSRVLTEEEVRQVIHDLPLQLKQALGINSPCLEPQSHHDWESNEAESSFPSVEENNVHDGTDRPPDIASTDAAVSASSEQKPSIVQHKSQSGLVHDDSVTLDSESSVCPPTGIRARQLFQNLRGIRKSPPTYSKSVSALDPEFGSGAEGTTTLHVSNEDLRPWSHLQNESPVQTTVGDLNELSQVYSRVIRDLDREHRRQVHGKDKELDQLRILLHEKDIVYRQQLKGKDFIIDDLKKKLDHFEETLEAKLEWARNEVEDLWETRWKEHDRQLMAKCGLIKSSSRVYIDNGCQATTESEND